MSAIVCTYDRADFVVRAIDSLNEQTLARSAYEIVVVDNGGDERLRRKLEETRGAVTNLRYVPEPRLGLSWARNRGAAAARGQILAFLDDDAGACPGWLAGLAEAFARLQPRPGLICGPVEPIWGAPRPAWLTEQCLPMYTVLDWGPVARDLAEREWVAGANFAVTREVLEACGPFDPLLGRRGSSLLSGEETALTERIRAAGYRIHYDPALVVAHYIHPERLTRSWYYRRVFWGGASLAIRHREADRTWTASLRQIMRYGKRIARRLFAVGSLTEGQRRMRWMRDMAWDFGRLYGLILARRDA